MWMVSSHEIKRRSSLGRKAMTNLDSVLKSRDVTLLTKVHIVKTIVFPVVMYGYDTAATAKSLQSCPTLCDPIDSSPPGSPIPGTLQARTLEWVAISFSNAWKWKVKVKVKSCPTLSDPMDCSLPGSSIHEICQARVLEWVVIAFSKKPTYLHCN